MEVKPFWPRQRRAASYQPVHLLVLEGSACLVQMGMANRVWSKPTGKLPETGRSRPVEQSKGVIVHVGCTWRRAEQSKDVVVHVGRHLETDEADRRSSRRVSSYMLDAPGDGRSRPVTARRRDSRGQKTVNKPLLHFLAIGGHADRGCQNQSFTSSSAEVDVNNSASIESKICKNRIKLDKLH